MATEDNKIYYPVLVDGKTLSALIGTADAIFRNPNPERFEMWEKMKKLIYEQRDHDQLNIALRSFVRAIDPTRC